MFCQRQWHDSRLIAFDKSYRRDEVDPSFPGMMFGHSTPTLMT